MNTYRRSLNALALALLATVFFWLAPAHGAGDDVTAIARFLSIGFANAGSNFTRIQTGEEFGFGSYRATKWPDKTHFQWCYVRHYNPPGYGYECKSTPRTVSKQALFDMAAAAVRANLSSGYASKGLQEFNAGGLLYQEWRRSGKPTVVLMVDDENDRSSYDISVQRPK
jgi:hypothetical protein